MPRLLDALAGAAAVYGGIQAGQDAQYKRSRQRMLDSRADEEYDTYRRPALDRAESAGQRQESDAARESRDKNREKDLERGAEDAAKKAANDPAAVDSSGIQTLPYVPGSDSAGSTPAPLGPVGQGEVGNPTGVSPVASAAPGTPAPSSSPMPNDTADTGGLLLLSGAAPSGALAARAPKTMMPAPDPAATGSGLFGASQPGATPAATTADTTPANVSGAPATGSAAPASAPAAGNAAAGAAPAQPQGAVWYRAARAQAEYWMKNGRPERAQKVMTDTINAALAEQEAKFKYEIQPQVEAARRQGVSADALATDAKLRGLKEEVVDHEHAAAGLMWGHVVTGNVRAAIDAFNASGTVQPGTQVASIARSNDGTKVVLLDENGRIAKDQQGRDLVYPRQALDALWRKAQASTLKLTKNDRLVNVTRNADGTTSAREALPTSDDPAAARKDKTDKRNDDKAWADVINKARDDARSYLKDSLGLTPNTLGQVMKPNNAPTFERALPYVEEELGKLRASGTRLDEVQASAIAKHALDRARDDIDRQAASAGPRAPGTASNPASGPTWRDMLK